MSTTPSSQIWDMTWYVGRPMHFRILDALVPSSIVMGCVNMVHSSMLSPSGTLVLSPSKWISLCEFLSCLYKRSGSHLNCLRAWWAQNISRSPSYRRYIKVIEKHHEDYIVNYEHSMFKWDTYAGVDRKTSCVSRISDKSMTQLYAIWRHLTCHILYSPRSYNSTGKKVKIAKSQNDGPLVPPRRSLGK